MSSDQTSSGDQSSTSEPSMLGGHVKYVQGAVSSALGYESGQQTKLAAVQEMKEANSGDSPRRPADAPTQSSILGTVEKTIGQVTGCDGLVEDGQRRIPPKAGVEETSGTG